MHTGQYIIFQKITSYRSGDVIAIFFYPVLTCGSL